MTGAPLAFLSLLLSLLSLFRHACTIRIMQLLFIWHSSSYSRKIENIPWEQNPSIVGVCCCDIVVWCGSEPFIPLTLWTLCVCGSQVVVDFVPPWRHFFPASLLAGMPSLPFLSPAVTFSTSMLYLLHTHMVCCISWPHRETFLPACLPALAAACLPTFPFGVPSRVWQNVFVRGQALSLQEKPSLFSIIQALDSGMMMGDFQTCNHV